MTMTMTRLIEPEKYLDYLKEKVVVSLKKDNYKCKVLNDFRIKVESTELMHRMFNHYLKDSSLFKELIHEDGYNRYYHYYLSTFANRKVLLEWFPTLSTSYYINRVMHKRREFNDELRLERTYEVSLERDGVSLWFSECIRRESFIRALYL